MSDTSPPARAAFEREILGHLDAVYRTALRLCGDPPDAEDLAQETMLKAFRSWRQYAPGTNAKAWLLTILRNTFINRYRQAKHAPTVDLDAIEPYVVFRDVRDADPEGAFFESIVDEEVVRAIDALPPEFREIVVLADVEDLSYAEIGQAVGIPVGTVKSRLFRGRQLLQRRLYQFAVDAGYVRRRRDTP